MSESGLPVCDPSLVDVFNIFRRNFSAALHFCEVGKIESFDATKKTASIKLFLKWKKDDGTSLEMPLLVDCPVMVYQGGGLSVQMPVSVGDNCLVVFSDRDIDAWFKAGAIAEPFTDRSHDISDGFAIVGVCSLASTIPAISSTQGGIVSSDASVIVKKDGSAASVKQGTAEVTAKGGKAVVKNGTTDLLTLIDGLIDLVKGLTVVDPVSGALPVSPAVQLQLENYKATVAGLLAAS